MHWFLPFSEPNRGYSYNENYTPRARLGYQFQYANGDRRSGDWPKKPVKLSEKPVYCVKSYQYQRTGYPKDNYNLRQLGPCWLSICWTFYENQKNFPSEKALLNAGTKFQALLTKMYEKPYNANNLQGALHNDVMQAWLFKLPVSPVFHTVVTVSIGIKNISRVRAFYNIRCPLAQDNRMWLDQT